MRHAHARTRASLACARPARRGGAAVTFRSQRRQPTQPTDTNSTMLRNECMPILWGCHLPSLSNVPHAIPFSFLALCAASPAVPARLVPPLVQP